MELAAGRCEGPELGFPALAREALSLREVGHPVEILEAHLPDHRPGTIAMTEMIRRSTDRVASSAAVSDKGARPLFDVGDRVVYPHHGAAVIVRRDTRVFDGKKTEYLVLEMAHGELTLSVPADKAEEVGMRPPIGTEEVQDLFELLGKKDVREPANWSRRFKNHQEKLKSGDVYQVAEVVRNLALRDQSKGLSAGEKAMFVKARSVLVSELSFALDVSEEDALEQVEKTLH